MRASVFALSMVMSITASASADPSPSEAATARILFDEARKLMKAGKYADACPKLEEGVRLNPGLGMRFNLAECWEHLGKTASAWSLYLDVAAGAKQKNDQKREKVAREAAKKLEPKLARLTIELEPEADVPGLEVKRNGAVVGAGQLGVAVAVDPGSYTVEAAAPDRKPWETKVAVTDAGKIVVRVPKLALVPKPPPPPPPPPPEKPGLGPTRILAIGLAGAGVIGLGLGTYFGARALTLNSDSQSHCNGNLCDPEGFEKRLDARRAGSTSTVAIIAGAVGVGIGAALWFTAPSPKSETSKTQVGGLVLPGYGGLSLSGSF
ncbi:MAG: hypothetical protein ACXVEE_25335 [Polyangiales bacterium]